MSDFISKKELYHKLGEAYNKGYLAWGANEIIKDILGVCDSVEKKGEDRPKGHWIEVVTGRFPNGEKRMWHYECSACSKGEPPCPINKEHWDFCPNCGADMRGKAE